ncbi:DUF1524 domain-containing protein [Demequina sp. SYSU T00192]|uniref:DUF1524 domain-containing protein n=1 Tax=Demequina litoralis TaxID=3051660 RepID=A0ABT8G6S7_9MICO|nr:DUF1524 domain-containing protein [Demequina sp. SYSU T00192]MDN4474697.1 DUF1524 domain-containing protein [Demequina sp. SYSU T00192]
MRLHTSARLLAVVAATTLAVAACSTPTGTVSPVGDPAPAASSTVTAAPTVAPTEATAQESTPRPSHGDAYAAALQLTVKGRAPKTGYDRDEFGDGWQDTDGNGCDARNDMLALRLTDVEMQGDCIVLAGTLADPYTATEIRFQRGGASEVDIDHIVALSDAWQKGAFAWDEETRVEFANDPLNLEPVDAGANRQKGDADAASWLPSSTAFRCDYVARQIAVKAAYGVWVTQAELDAMLLVLDTCPGQGLPARGDDLDVVVDPSVPVATGEATPSPTATAASSTDPRFSSCAKALDAGYGPYVRGEDEEYGWYRDGDGDGTVCER